MDNTLRFENSCMQWKNSSPYLSIPFQALILVMILALSRAYLKSLFSNLSRYNKTTSCARESGTSHCTENQYGRRISYTSALIAMGSLPETTKVYDPLIHVLISFEGTDFPTKDDLVPLVHELMKYERMAGIPNGSFGKNNWTFTRINMDGFNPMDMIQTIVCDTDDEVKVALNETMQMSLRNTKEENLLSNDSDHNKELPWWRFVIIENKEKCDSQLLLIIDHVIGDGISLGKVILKLLSNIDGSRPVDATISERMLAKKKIMLGSVTNFLLKLIPSFLHVSYLPISKFDDNIEIFKGMGTNMVKSELRPPKLIFLDPIPLDFIKELKTKAGVTLNDVLLAAYSQALNRICTEQGCGVLKRKKSKTQCRVLMPYAMPSEPKDLSLSNKFTFVPINIQVGHDTIQKRLELINIETQKMKGSPFPLCQLALVNTFFALFPVYLARKIIQNEFIRFSSTFSNVPGPQKQVKIADKRVRSCRFWVPHLLPTVSILSYNNRLYVTIVANDVTLPQASLIPNQFGKALIDLADGLGVHCPSEIRT